LSSLLQGALFIIIKDETFIQNTQRWWPNS